MPLLVGGVAVLMLFIAIVFGGALGAVFTIEESGVCSAGPAPTAGTVADIPPDYLALYQQAGAKYGIPWPILAAIGSVESRHGQDSGAGIHSGANPWGAMGPMQFLAATWATYGVDGNHDGIKNVYDPADAIPAAANLLKANGAPAHLETAIFDYNHADWYVQKVLDQARVYAGGQDPHTLGEAAGGCMAGVLAPNRMAAAVIGYAQAQLGKPYVWGAAGPDAFDCSGLTMMAYRQAGISLPHNAADQWNSQPHVPPEQAQPGDLIFFVTDGSTSAPGHVGIYLGGGQMIEAPNHTAPVRISSAQRPDLVGYARPAVGQEHL